MSITTYNANNVRRPCARGWTPAARACRSAHLLHCTLAGGERRQHTQHAQVFTSRPRPRPRPPRAVPRVCLGNHPDAARVHWHCAVDQICERARAPAHTALVQSTARPLGRLPKSALRSRPLPSRGLRAAPAALRAASDRPTAGLAALCRTGPAAPRALTAPPPRIKPCSPPRMCRRCPTLPWCPAAPQARGLTS